jgi:hypothetical protein
MRRNLFNLPADDQIGGKSATLLPTFIVDPSPSGFVVSDNACGLGVEHIVFFKADGLK